MAAFVGRGSSRIALLAEARKEGFGSGGKADGAGDKDNAAAGGAVSVAEVGGLGFEFIGEIFLVALLFRVRILHFAHGLGQIHPGLVKAIERVNLVGVRARQRHPAQSPPRRWW